jgi:hypothetical protein
MSTLAYHYRATIYGADDATALVPAVGAAHSDNFKITTQTAIVGWKSYIMGSFPTGRRGSLDRKTGRYSIGEVTLRVLDAKVNADNLERWVTAFFGDASGRLQFKGKLILIEEYNGSAWSDYYKGRIFNVKTPDPAATGPVVEFVIREELTQAKRNVFVGAPHPDVTYAQGSPLLPLGSYWTVSPLSGSIVSTTYGAALGVGDLSFSSAALHNTVRLCKALATRADYRVTDPATGRKYCPQVRIHVDDGSTSGDFYLAECGKNISSLTSYDGIDGANIAPIWLRRQYVGLLGLLPIPNDVANTAHPFKYKATPTAGTHVTFYVYNAGPPSPDAALLINDVHPATLRADLLAGKFSMLNDQGAGVTGDAGDGTVAVRAISYDATSFSSIAADGNVPTVRLAIDRPWKLQDFLIALTQHDHLAGRTKGDGKVYLKDLRLSSTSIAGLTTIGADDVIGGDWEQGEDAVGLVAVKVYAEKPMDPAELGGTDEPIIDVPAHGFRETVEYVGLPTQLFTDASAESLSVDARGSKPPFSGDPSGDALGRATAIALPYDQMFGTSAAYYRGTFRRTTNTDLWPGDWTLVDADEIPNTATNLRGGTRVFLCLERSDEGPARSMRFVDAGPNSVATAPTVATPVQNATVPKHAIDTDITLNADTEPAYLQVAITDTATSVVPADGDDAWTQTRRPDCRHRHYYDRQPAVRLAHLGARPHIATDQGSVKLGLSCRHRLCRHDGAGRAELGCGHGRQPVRRAHVDERRDRIRHYADSRWCGCPGNCTSARDSALRLRQPGGIDRRVLWREACRPVRRRFINHRGIEDNRHGCDTQRTPFNPDTSGPRHDVTLIAPARRVHYRLRLPGAGEDDRAFRLHAHPGIHQRSLRVH